LKTLVYNEELKGKMKKTKEMVGLKTEKKYEERDTKNKQMEKNE
jgi:hypothetical protein